MAFPILISLKPTNSEPEYHPDRQLNVESIGRSSFAPYKFVAAPIFKKVAAQ
jgi:hypothetical protein